MRRFSRLLFMLSIVAITGLIALTLVPLAAADPSEGEVVADGLDNPRGLAFGPEGALYVAEAGSGSTAPCAEAPCIGDTGAVTRIWNGEQERVATGLPSTADPEGGFALGPVDIDFRGRGNAIIIIGLGTDPNNRDLFPAAADFGHTAQMAASGNWRLLTDVAQFEANNDPDGDGLDSNPYSILNLPGRQIVADAGANALLEVRRNGEISVLELFEERDVDGVAMDPVPNAVALGPDGAFYVGELTGFPFPLGQARVYRVVDGEPAEVFADGFTNIIDLAWGPDGDLYVLEITSFGLGDVEAGLAPPYGALKKYDPDADDISTVIAADGTLTAPTGLTFGPDGDIYISNNGIFPAAGEVLRFAP